jgi:hypothetical protein
MAAILSALRYNHPTWTWGDIKAALRQTASNWPTAYAAYNSASLYYSQYSSSYVTGPAFGYGNINFVAANSVSHIYLQPPGMAIQNFGWYVVGTIYPFLQTRRAREVVYIGGSWPSPAIGCGGSTCNEYTAAQIAAAGGTLVYTSSGESGVEEFVYNAPRSGSATFVALTLDSSGNGSRVENFMYNTQTFSVGAMCFAP